MIPTDSWLAEHSGWKQKTHGCGVPERILPAVNVGLRCYGLLKDEVACSS